MREVKFRAWDKEEKRMLYGDDVVITYNEICFEDMKKEDCKNAKGMRLWVKEQDDVIGVHDAVFMQYTGLKDRNGKEIYEGDILALKTHYNEVVFGFVVFNYGAFCLSSRETYYDDELISNLGVEFEVIGNIYENPELLESEK